MIFFPPGSWVTYQDGRVGRVAQVVMTETTLIYLVQFGSAGPIQTCAHRRLRLAEPSEIAEEMGAAPRRRRRKTEPPEEPTND